MQVTDATIGTGPAVYAAVELSRSSWLVAVLAPGAQQASRHKLAAGDAKRLLALLSVTGDAAARRLGAPVRRVSCYEAGYEGFWLHRVLETAGVESHVVDPSSLQTNRRARRRKTDRLDVEAILRVLLAWDRGERAVCAMVRPPDPASEDARRLSRERERLLKERIGHENRIRGLLMTVGLYGIDPRAPAAFERLITGDGRPLPEQLTAELRREAERLRLVDAQIAAVEAKRDGPKRRPGRPSKATPRPQPPDDAASRMAVTLQQLRGVGPEIASVLSREVFWRDFKNRREIAAYCGLDPTPHASGDVAREQGISKAGNRRARKVLTELAWLWLLWQQESALAHWFAARVGDTKGRARRIALVALARKLLIALWRFAQHGVIPEGAVLRAA